MAAAEPALRRTRGAGPRPTQRPVVRPAEETGAADLARMIADQFGSGPVHEVHTTIIRRAPHDFLGEEGYSLVSNYFLRRVLPYCLTHRIITTLQGAILANLIGRQKRGKIATTHAEIAEEIGVQRTSIGAPLEGLCRMNLLRKIKRGVYELNPRVAFNGNGNEQADFLARLRAAKLESKFPDELGEVLTLFANTDVR
ncbi:replication/maintenance protein RepL [Streptomyces erythrochromogenes]|uniref:replication/maintenance protein RepL n=1 Tax=Streptomyces erythrochromogenes TaxID=285574 RepID=UPI0036BE9EBB